MRLNILAAACLCVASSPAFAIEFTPQDNGIVDFDMPSGNICCSFVPDAPEGALLSCSRIEPEYWIVTLLADGSLSVNKDPDEVPGCGFGKPMGNTFRYGSTWRKSAFECHSSETGLECSANGRGFKLRRAGITEF
jgi:hypothetical protein